MNYNEYLDKMNQLFDHDLSYSEFLRIFKNNYSIIMTFYILKKYHFLKKEIDEKTIDKIIEKLHNIDGIEFLFDEYFIMKWFDYFVSSYLEYSYMTFANEHITIIVTCSDGLASLYVKSGEKILTEAKLRHVK